MAKLWQEIGKKQPFETPEQEAFLSVLRTASVLELSFARLFKQYGLSGTTYNILRILRGEGGEGVACMEISRRLITRVPDVTRLVNTLEKARLVERQRGNDDRRVVRICLTDAGRQTLAKLDPQVAVMHKQLLGHMSPEELEQLANLLSKAREGVKETT